MSKHLACIECGKVFDIAKQASRTRPEFDRTPQGPRCNNRPACRGTQLSKKLDERGVKQWNRQSQQEHLAIMDVPPAGWDRTQLWESVHLPHERLLAAIKFFSICWPVCLEFAVQTDPDGNPVWEIGEWKRHTHRSLATFLHMGQPLVTRNLAYLRRRHLITEDDGRIYPQLDPAKLDEADRFDCTVVNGTEKGFGVLPVGARNLVRELRAVVTPDVYTGIKSVALDACTGIKKAINDARTAGSKVVLDACEPYLSLLSRPGEGVRPKPPRASSSSSTVPPPSQSPTQEGLSQGEREQLYAEGHGKGALAKLPSPRPKPTTTKEAPEFEKSAEARISRALQPFAVPDSHAVRSLILECRRRASDATVEEIIFFIEDRGPIAKTKKRPMGFLLTAVPNCFVGATFEEFRAQGGVPAARSMSATAGGGTGEEPYAARKAREILEHNEHERAQKKER